MFNSFKEGGSGERLGGKKNNMCPANKKEGPGAGTLTARQSLERGLMGGREKSDHVDKEEGMTGRGEKESKGSRPANSSNTFL